MSTDRLQLKPLFEVTAACETVTEMSGMPRGALRVVEFTRFDCSGGRFAAVLNPASAAEWTTIAPDGIATAEGRVALAASGGEVVYMRWVGRWDASTEGAAPPRVVALFEANGACAWLNKTVAVGTVHADGATRRFQLFQLAVEANHGADATVGCTLEPLFMLDNTVDVAGGLFITESPGGSRAIGAVRVADLRSDRVRAHLHGNAAGDWASVSAEHTVLIDVIETLETDDGALIQVSYRGSTDATAGAYTTPSYVVGLFETGDPRYTWLNRVLAIGEGRHEVPEVVSYHFYELR